MAYMSAEDFNKVVDEQCEYIKATLASKAEEYSTGGDRLHNFNQMARVNETTAAKEIWHMAGKHLSCILDMVHGRTTPTEFMVNEKIGDMINYLIILKAHYKNELKLGDVVQDGEKGNSIRMECAPRTGLVLEEKGVIVEYVPVNRQRDPWDTALSAAWDRCSARRKREGLAPLEPTPLIDSTHVIAFTEFHPHQLTEEQWFEVCAQLR